MSKLKTYKFSKLYEMSSGISSKPEQAGHGSPFVSFKIVFNNFFLPEILNEYMAVSENDKITYSIKKGDVFLTRTSESLDELAMSCVADKDYPGATYSGFLKRLRPIQNDITYDRFMAFYLRSELFRKTVTNNAIMTLRASFNEQIFSYLNLILPNYIEQKKSGDFLYFMNQKVNINNRINAELEAMAKTLYDYWFVQFDFPNAEDKPYKTSGGKMVYNGTLKREIPEGWEVKNLFEVCNVQYGFPFSTEYFNEVGNGIPVIRIRDIIENSVSNYSTEKNIDSKYEILKGDLLIGMDGNFHINYWTKNNCYLNQRVVKLTEKELPNIYLRYQIEPYIKAREASVSRTTVGHLSDKDLKAINILVPPKEIKLKIKNIYSNALNKIITNKEQNQELSALRDWLLPMLMNGQVKVE